MTVIDGVFCMGMRAVAYLRGGMVRCPPLVRPWKFFTGDFIWKGAFFAVFQQISEKNGRICGFHWTFKSKKCFSFRPPDQGLCPWTPLGAPPPDSRYRLALYALAMPPLCQILNTPLDADPRHVSTVTLDWNKILGSYNTPVIVVKDWRLSLSVIALNK